MPTSKHRRTRRAHRPQPARIPIVYRLAHSDEVQLQLVPHVELDKVRLGTATEETWHTLAFRINVGQTLAHQHFGDAEKDTMARAIVAIVEVGQRFQRTGRLGVTGDQYRALGAGLNLTDQIQRETTRRQQLAANQLVFHRAGQDSSAITGQFITSPVHNSQ